MPSQRCNKKNTCTGGGNQMIAISINDKEVEARDGDE